jgi:hypothetical protein
MQIWVPNYGHTKTSITPSSTATIVQTTHVEIHLAFWSSISLTEFVTPFNNQGFCISCRSRKGNRWQVSFNREMQTFRTCQWRGTNRSSVDPTPARTLKQCAASDRGSCFEELLGGKRHCQEPEIDYNDTCCGCLRQRDSQTRPHSCLESWIRMFSVGHRLSMFIWAPERNHIHYSTRRSWCEIGQSVVSFKLYLKQSGRKRILPLKCNKIHWILSL